MFSKPEFPYVVGKSLQLRAHEPPAPVKRYLRNDDQREKEQQSVHPLDRCLRHPPLQGRNGQTGAEARIVRPIRAADGHRAQLLAVRIMSSSSHTIPLDRDLVAKIYDPLYFDDMDEFDPFLSSDAFYTHEAAAYTKLSALQGDAIPRYFGSFTIRWPARQTSRLVRLVLMELIPGRSLYQLMTTSLPRTLRQSIMKKIVDAESAICARSVRHKDVRPINIMIGMVDGKVKRVAIVDFGYCDLEPHSDPAAKAPVLPDVPISPLLRWWDLPMHFDSFVDWNWRHWLQHVYKSTEASITEDMRELWAPETAAS